MACFVKNSKKKKKTKFENSLIDPTDDFTIFPFHLVLSSAALVVLATLSNNIFPPLLRPSPYSVSLFTVWSSVLHKTTGERACWVTGGQVGFFNKGFM